MDSLHSEWKYLHLPLFSVIPLLDVYSRDTCVQVLEEGVWKYLCLLLDGFGGHLGTRYRENE